MDMSKKIVLKLEMNNGRDKQKAIKAVSALVGVDAITVDMASKKMTVIGMVDPVKVVSKLRKASCPATFVSIGPAKEPEKKEEKKEEKEEKKDGDAAKKEGEGEKKKEGDGEKKDGDGEKKKEGDGDKKAPPPTEQITAEVMNQYRAYHPYMAPPPHYYVQSMEENPNSCVIC